MAEKLDLDALERANLGKVVRPEDWMALLSYARALESDGQPGSGEAWQAIETAPKDGSMFLGWVSAVRSTYPDSEYGGDADVSEHDFCRWTENGGNGYWDNMMGQIGDQQDVTHWMPLPAAPSAGNGEAKGGRE